MFKRTSKYAYEMLVPKIRKNLTRRRSEFEKVVKGTDKALEGLAKESKVDVKSKGGIKKTKEDEHRKRYTALGKAEEKVKTGKKMMREGQKERKRMVDTGRAFQFKGGSRHAIEPGEDPKVKYKGLLKENK